MAMFSEAVNHHKNQVKLVYAAIVKQAVADYVEESGGHRPSVIMFLRSEWGHDVLDVLGYDNEAFERDLKRYAKNNKKVRKEVLA